MFDEKRSNMEEIQKKRLEKYSDKVEAKPSTRNQLYIREGQAKLIKNGQMLSCNKVEGYVKLPEMNRLETIDQLDMAIAFLPKNRMIIRTADQTYFRGYKEYNSSDCMLLLHVSGQEYDLLVADIAEDIPALIAIDDGEEDDIVNPISYQIMERLMRSPLQECNTVDMVEGDDDDEWE